MAGASFTRRIGVTAEHLDDVGHVNNVVYLQWVQDVAIDHWRATASADDQAGYVWVVRRHEVDYLAPAFAGDVLEARTWIGAWTSVTCERWVEIHRPADTRVLLRARSLWVALDGASGRPRRISPELLDRFTGPGA